MCRIIKSPGDHKDLAMGFARENADRSEKGNPANFMKSFQ